MESPGLLAQFHEKIEEIIIFIEENIDTIGGEPKDIRNLIEFFKDLKTEIRKYRICDISIPDVLSVLITSCSISWFTNYPYFYVLIFMLFLGIIVHRVLGVRSKSDRFLFPDNTINGTLQKIYYLFYI